MDKPRNLNKLTNFFLLLTVLNSIRHTTQSKEIIIVLLCAAIFSNDYLRLHFFKKYYSFLLIPSLVLASIITIFSNTLITSYICISIFEILNIKINKQKYMLFFINFLSYFTPVLTIASYNQGFINWLKEASLYMLPYVCAAGGMFISLNKRRERIKIKELNDELRAQNLKLQEYASKVEEFTLLEERNRVAQDLHDSLGHYLMAISMHLNILEKTVSSSPEKSLVVVSKTKEIVKQSISELRNTVFELKKESEKKSFILAINDLTKNLSTLNEVSFYINIDNSINEFTPFVQDILYKTIKESITNGLKHGNAKNFFINSFKENNTLKLSIKNDGISPSDIIKSNGLKGIESRILLINGSCEFNILDEGFEVISTIPFKEALLIK